MLPSSLTMALPPSFIQTQDTKTGLMLAGRVAQNNRDWDAAQDHYSTLIDKFGSNAQMELRAMTLALGSGDYDQAVDHALRIDKDYLSQDDFADDNETFDLARLLLIAKAVKENKVERADNLLNDLNDGPLTDFTKPLIAMILNAGKDDFQFDRATGGMSALQQVYKALSAEKAGQIDVAKTIFANVARQRITPQTSEMIAGFYMRHGEQDEAIRILEDAQRDFPEDQKLTENLMLLKNNADDYEMPRFASYHLESLPALLSLAFHDFARVMLSERAADSALLFAHMAAYTDPKTPGIWLSIGDITASQGQSDSALVAYKKVTSDDDDYLSAQIEVAEMLRDKNKTDEAIDHLETLLKGDDNKRADLYLTLGNLYKWDNQCDKAIDIYDIAETMGLEENKGQAPDWLWFLHYFRGVCFDLIDRHADAEKDLLRALDAQPNNATLLNYLGYSYADKGENLDKAKDMIERAVQQAPDDAYIIDSMGWVLYRMGDYNGAVEYLERAAKMMPYHAVINDHLGDAYWKVGRRLEAYYMWQRAVDYMDSDAAEGMDASAEEQAEAARKASDKLKNGLIEE